MQYNVAIIGQSGVGKSSLINYLFGEDIRKTGNGEPVTERGFHPVPLQLDELPLMIYDSWGLEPDKADLWMQDLEDTLQNRGIDKSPSEWMHSIFFCIAAPKLRVQDFELKIIKKIIKENCPVTVLFTKADNVPDDKIESLKQEITNAFGKKVNTVKVCSVTKATRRGPIEPFGKTEIKQEISEHFKLAITKRLPKRCIYNLTEIVNRWEESQKVILRNSTGLFNRKKPYLQMQKNTNELINDLNSGMIERVVFQEIESTVKMYQFLFEKLNLDSGLPIPRILKYNLELNMKEYNMTDTFATIIANIIFPIGIFFTKDMNYDDLCRELRGYTSRMQFELKELEPLIRKSIRSVLDAAYE